VVPRLEELEPRLTPSGSVTLTNAFLVNAVGQALTAAPDIGEEVFVQADFTTQGLPADASYQISYSVDGVTLLSDPLTFGAGDSTTESSSIYLGGWFASPGPHNVAVTVTPTTYGTTTQSFSFTPITAPDLPAKFLTPLGGTPFRTWNISTYVDVDPRGGSLADYTGGTITYDCHTGHDLALADFAAMDAGVPVYAAAAGTVVAVQDGAYDRNTSFSGQANSVEIDHGNGWHTLYAHFRTDTILVHVGDAVTAGQVLGLAGSSGDSTGAHLHFQVMHNGGLVEPEYDPTTYWAKPLPYQGTVRDILDSSVTSVHTPAVADIAVKERPVTANVFTEAGGQPITVWFVGSTRVNDRVAFQFYRPNGSHDTALDHSFLATGSPVGYWYGTTLPANLPAGTWHVGIDINGTRMALDPFRVTSKGAGAASVAQGSTYVPNGRTTPIDFGTAAVGDPPPQLTFTISNLGSAALGLGNLALPQGFSLVGALPSRIAVGGSATFTVQMATGMPGTAAGILSFGTTDPNAPTYRFAVRGTVNGGDPGAIHGQVFDDVNSDGIEDGTETGLVGWTVSLLDPNTGQVLATTTTGNNGYYAFLNLAAGTYRVRETPPSGWYATTADPPDVTVGTVDVLVSPFGVTPAVANHLAVAVVPVGGVAGTALSPAVQVQVIDQKGNVLASDDRDPITVAVMSGPGGFTSGSTTTVSAVNGVATFTNLVLTAAGTYTLGATAPGGLTGPASTSFPLGPAAASASASVVSVSTGSVTAGDSITVTLQARDVYGNDETSGGLMVAFALGNGAAQGTFGPVTDQQNGTYTVPFTGTSAGGNTISATLAGQSGSATPAAVTVTPGPVSLAESIVTVSPPSVALGDSTTVTLLARDDYGNDERTGGLTVAIALGTGDGSGTLGTVTDRQNGTYTALFTGTAVGTTTITATIDGQAVTSPPPTVIIAGPADHLAVQAPVQAIVGGKFTVTVTADDARDHTNPDYSGWAILMLATGPAGGRLMGDTLAPFRQGVATFPGLSFTAVGGGYQLLASGADDLVAALSDPIAVSPTTHFAVTAPPGPVMAGQPFSVTVSALGAAGQADASYLGTIHFTSTDPRAPLPAAYTFQAGDGGTKSFAITLKTAGPQTIAVTDLTLPTARGTSLCNVHAAPVSDLSVIGFPTLALAGAGHFFRVTAVDPCGNRVGSYRGTIAFTSSDPEAILPPAYTFTALDSGAHTFRATLRTVGSQSLTVTDQAVGSITGAETGIDVAHLAAGISGPTLAVRGQPLTFMLTATEDGQPAGAVFTYRIDWLGTGTALQVVSGASGLTVDHVYPAAGSFTVAVTVADSAGNVDPRRATQLLTVRAAALEPDPAETTKTALVVGGTPGTDVITISPTDGSGQMLAVSINGVAQGVFAPTGHVLVYGQNGDDTIREVSQTINGQTVTVALPAVLFGGAGNDTLSVVGSSADNVLVGGTGSNHLTGGSGQDILIGGSGAATLQAGHGGDVLIAGSTSYDANVAALLALLAEWDRPDRTYSQRVQDLFGTGSGGLNGGFLLDAQTVACQAALGELIGGPGPDWFWLSDRLRLANPIRDYTEGEVISFES
jgi:hypothetical protein